MNTYFLSIVKIATLWVALLAALGLAGCSDTDYVQGGKRGDDIRLNLNFSAITMQEGDSDNPEKHIYSLRLIVFRLEEGRVTGVERNGLLYNNAEVPLTKERIIQLPAGTYKMYFIGNAENSGLLGENPFTGINDEEDLEKLILSYSREQMPGLPLVMTGCLDADDYNENKDVTVEMYYSCVKVTYTLSFDNEYRAGENEISDDLKGRQFELRSVTFRNLADRSYLLPNDASIVAEEDVFDGHSKEEFRVGEDELDFRVDNWTYTDSIYIPEYIYKDLTKDPAVSCMEIVGGIVGSAINSTYTIPLQEDAESHTPRSTEYIIDGKILSRGDKDGLEWVLTHSWWSASSDEGLKGDEGDYFLTVEKTWLHVDLIDHAFLGYATDQPDSLSFESVKIFYQGADHDVFIIEPVDGEDQLEISVNPTIKAGTNITSISEFYIYVVVGKIKKRIEIELDLEPMLRVTPYKHILKIDEIVNNDWTKIFTYVTNLDTLTVEKRNAHESGALVTYDEQLKAKFMEELVCTVDSQIANTLQRPHTIYLDFEADGTNTLGDDIVLKQTVEIVIIPENPSYRLYFRDIWDNWTNPHIYAYEPLYTGDGEEVLIWGSEGENSLKYSWTGNLAYGKEFYEGTASNGPDVLVSTSEYNVVDYNDGRLCSHGGDFNLKWPGIQMLPDPENPGWYYYDIPYQATPGTTLIMFADTHDPKDGSTLTDDRRYPAHMKPGMSLFNYDDYDGWFLYDPTERLHEFTDDKPNIPDREDIIIYKVWFQANGIPSGWGDLYIHIFIDSSSLLYPWADAATKMKKESDNLYSYTFISTSTDWFTKTGDSGIIIHNGMPTGGNANQGPTVKFLELSDDDRHNFTIIGGSDWGSTSGWSIRSGIPN